MKKILVVDDDAMNLKMAEFILKQKGYEITKVSSGMEAVDFLKENPQDLVLLDIEMPMMNGIKTLELIRSNEEMKDVLVMFLSASVDPETEAKAESLGAVGDVKKPFLPANLQAEVARVLGE